MFVRLNYGDKFHYVEPIKMTRAGRKITSCGLAIGEEEESYSAMQVRSALHNLFGFSVCRNCRKHLPIDIGAIVK